MLEKIFDEEELLGLIVRDRYTSAGVTFFTDDDATQQVAFMKHPAGKEILPHVHNSVKREVFFTSEVLIMKSGILRVDFYSSSKVYLQSRTLYAGDVILLAGGGHGFFVIEEIEMIEVKQGPYLGEMDKVRFSAVDVTNINLK
ncbi:cupin domain-containing protein [Williamwhitmania taraxaci]|uniref:Mannose-6-phosphate isomerase, cupin superfamily n=1 Tax=Williamwhitmania taraxaci TaxID=1640674 RepID=A0A1G6GL98_9BACT|nr:hypothetical protein [Williamwhitmania taraxaci]SDB82781.1 Mannose-6-phosphate isomerase, cupin superfamily [Williamwhitmania taraxaci]